LPPHPANTKITKESVNNTEIIFFIFISSSYNIFVVSFKVISSSQTGYNLSKTTGNYFKGVA